MTTSDSARTDTPPERASAASGLRTLYFVRFAFAIVWAALLALTGGSLGPLTVALLALYPAVDLVAAVVDRRVSRPAGSTPVLYANMALSLLATVGILLAAPVGASAVLIVWGVWAITAGIVQLVVAIQRRSLGGQWPMILSGGLSVLAGSAFALQGAGGASSVTALAGYATLGGVFFLISALRLQRTAKAGR